MDYLSILLNLLESIGVKVLGQKENSGISYNINVENHIDRTKTLETLITEYNKLSNTNNTIAVFDSGGSSAGRLLIKDNNNPGKNALFTLILKNKGVNLGNLAEIIYGFALCAYFTVANLDNCEREIEKKVFDYLSECGKAWKNDINKKNVKTYTHTLKKKREKVAASNMDIVNCEISIGSTVARCAVNMSESQKPKDIENKIKEIINNCQKSIQSNKKIFNIIRLTLYNNKIDTIECKLIGTEDTETNKADIKLIVYYKSRKGTREGTFEIDISMKNQNTQVAQRGLASFVNNDVSEDYINFIKTYIGLSEESITKLRQTYKQTLSSANIFSDDLSTINTALLGQILFAKIIDLWEIDLIKNTNLIKDAFKKAFMGTTRINEVKKFVLEDIGYQHRLQPSNIDKVIDYLKCVEPSSRIWQKNSDNIKLIYKHKKQIEIFQIRLKRENKKDGGQYIRIYLQFLNGMYDLLKIAGG